MSDISDPGKAGRGDRKRAQKLIDSAYAGGRLTAADRALRTERVASARTKGDLAVLTRDLNRAETAAPRVTPPPVVTPPSQASSPSQSTPTTSGSLGSAIPPEQLSAMRTIGSARTIQLSETMRSALSGDNVRRIRRIVLIIVIGFIVLCGLGITGVVTAIVNQVDQVRDSTSTDSTPTANINLQTAKGWSGLVAAIDKKTGSTRVYDVVVYRDYASVNSVADEGAIRLFYRNGAFQDVSTLVTPASGEPVDLADVDADLMAGLPDEAAKRLDFADPDSAYLIVSASSGKPTISVYLQKSGRLARWMIFDLDGKPVGGSEGATLVD